MTAPRATQTSALARASAIWRAHVEVTREVREGTSKCLSLRPRGTPRPPWTIYDAGNGKADPYRTFRTWWTRLMHLRDVVPAADLSDFDHAGFAALDALVDWALTEKVASDHRRARDSNRSA